MAIEQGIVVKVGLKRQNMALVKTVQSSACEACSARGQCNPNVRGKEREVEAVNLVNAREGDLIQISMDTGALLKTTFLLYVFPICCMLVGAFVGNAIGTATNMGPSNASAIVGIAFFFLAMILVRKRAGKMALKLEYQPKITRIIGRGNKGELGRANSCGLEVTNNA